MRINGLPLPALLIANLREGRARLSRDERDRLVALLPRLVEPDPDLFSEETIERENRVWLGENAELYLGNVSPRTGLSRPDPKRLVAIGIAAFDCPIALDYRYVDPWVIYLGDVGQDSEWFKISDNYESFMNELRDG